MVKTTTSEAFSTHHMPGEKSAVKSGRRRGRQGISFAAILEKALRGPAAPEKTGARKGVSRATVPVSLTTGRTTAGTTASGTTKTEESLRKPEKIARNTEKRKPELQEHAVHADNAAEKRVTLLAPAAVETAAFSAAVSGTQAEAGKQIRTLASKSPAVQDNAVKADLTPGFGQALEPPEGTLAPGEKNKPAAEKKLSSKQESSVSRVKENHEQAAKNSENADASVSVRDIRVFSREDAKQDIPRQEIEIRVAFQAGDERLDDTQRMAEDRSVRESASGLLRRLREDANSDIVRSARFILKDSNEGEIRLVLKPESLGEVRIRLSMHDNFIGGRIIVENDSVRAAFQQNMPDLVSAFKQNGMELGSLNVSVDSGESRESGESRPDFIVFNEPAERETAMASALADAYYFVSHTVNVMA